MLAQRPVTGEVRVTGRRIIATWIDLFLLGLVYRLLASPLHLPLSIADRPAHPGPPPDGDFASRVFDAWPGIIVYCLIAALYYVVLEGTWGRTIGKRLTGIRVVSDFGGKAALGRIIGRTLLRPIDAMGGYLVGFLIAIVSPRRQRLGDHAAGTLVIRA
jgi:uncharacterized RDD family membrane protein YckC